MSLNRYVNLLISFIVVLCYVWYMYGMYVLSNFDKWTMPLKISSIVLICVFLIIFVSVSSMVLWTLINHGDLYELNFRKTKLENFILFPGHDDGELVFKKKTYVIHIERSYHFILKGYNILVVEDKSAYDTMKSNRKKLSLKGPLIVVFHDNVNELTWSRSQSYNLGIVTTSKEVYAKFKMIAP